MNQSQARKALVLKPIWWRQLCFGLFLLLCGVFFAFVNFLGPFLSWTMTIIMLLAGVLNLGDQLITWSRLKIDQDGYDLRTWWTRKKIPHQAIRDFELDEYMSRKLIMVCLRSGKGTSGNSRRPFPCAFGRPVDEVFSILRDNLDKTPRPLT